jgi:predicted GTPase
MLLSDFEEGRSILRKVVPEVVEVLKRVGLDQSVSDIEAVERRLIENRFNLVIMGQLKRGKSTFVNAFLRVGHLMPTGVIPVSSAIAKVQWAEQAGAEILFKDGNTETVGIDEIAEYCEEAKNPKNEKAVAEVRIGYPSDWLRDGVTLVDTPGEGSLETYHTEIVHHFIPQADAIIFLSAADYPLSRGEHKFLSAIAACGTQKVFFALNKIDRLTDEKEKERVSKYDADNIREIKGFEKITPDAFYLISAQKAIEDINDGAEALSEECGFPRLETDVAALLNRERAGVLLNHATGLVRGSLENVIKSLELEKQAAKRSVEENEEILAKIREKRAVIEADCEKDLQRFNESLSEAKRAFKSDLKQLLRDIFGKYEKKINRAKPFKIRRMVKHMPKDLEDEVSGRIPEIAAEAAEHFIRPAVEKLERSILAKIESLNDLGEDVDIDFNVPYSEVTGRQGTLAGAAIAAGGGLLAFAETIGAANIIWAWIAGGTANIWNPVGWAMIASGATLTAYFFLKNARNAKADLEDQVRESLQRIKRSADKDFSKVIRELKSAGESVVHSMLASKLEMAEEALRRTVDNAGQFGDRKAIARVDAAEKVARGLLAEVSRVDDILKERMRYGR